MCCVTGCTTGAAAVVGSGLWGLSGGGICVTHWADFDTSVKNKPGPPLVPVAHDPFYLDDYKRLAALMLDTTTVDAAMASLNTEITNAKGAALVGDERFSGKPHANYARLSRVLEMYEGLCWFPSTHLVYAGALSPAEFVGNLSSGFMPKDPGAGARHGDFSHRLQWHAVMRTVTNGFTVAKRAGWDHSPLELYVSFASPQATLRGLWGTIFDRQNNKKYQDPSTLEDQLRKGALAVLSDNLTRRFNKRNVLETKIFNYLVQQNKSNQIAAADVVAVLYRWRKVGGAPKVSAPNDPIEKVAWHFWHWWHKEKDPDYEAFNGNVVLKKKIDNAPTAPAIQQRVVASRNALNTVDFTYTALNGANRK
jgi:hypothetical protein